MGALVGLKINEDSNLLYQLFANDARIFLRNSQEEFENARVTIQVFQNTLGALLNVGKLVIVPIPRLDLLTLAAKSFGQMKKLNTLVV